MKSHKKTIEETQVGQESLSPDHYTFPAKLVADIYALLQQIPSVNAARVYVQLEDAIIEQVKAFKESVDVG